MTINTNIDIQDFGLLGGNGIRANHSFQFNHDAAETWGFYDTLKTEIGFASTQNAAASASAVAINERRRSEQAVAQLRQSVAFDAETAQSLFQPAKRDVRSAATRAVVFEQLGRPEQVANPPWRAVRLDLLLAEEFIGQQEKATESPSLIRHEKEEGLELEDRNISSSLSETLAFDHAFGSIESWLL